MVGIKPLKLPSASPKKQAENKVLWNNSRSQENADFFTIGYTGRTIEVIFDVLLKAGVSSLIDIRENPISMYRPELSKGNLCQSLQEHGIQYFHFPQLGVPRDIRVRAIKTQSRKAIWDWYDQYVVEKYLRSNLHWFFNGAEHPVALMCVEIDPTECHRHRIFMALEKMGLKGYDL